MTKKLSTIFKDKTKSDIPKTPRQKKMWIQARRIVAAQAGKKKRGVKGEQDLTPGQWGLVTTIYKDAKKADKIPKTSDWTKAKKEPSTMSYKKDVSSKHKRARV